MLLTSKVQSEVQIGKGSVYRLLPQGSSYVEARQLHMNCSTEFDIKEGFVWMAQFRERF
jgi:hypothetical protein